MGGRFGKYGDAKRKARIRKNRLRSPVSQQRRKCKPVNGSKRNGTRRPVRRKNSKGVSEENARG